MKNKYYITQEYNPENLKYVYTLRKILFWRFEQGLCSTTNIKKVEKWMKHYNIKEIEDED